MIEFYKLIGDKVVIANENEELTKPEKRLLSTEINIYDLSATVSTVFSPINLRIGEEDHNPIVFETMIFSDIEELDQKIQFRHDNLHAAIISHSDAIMFAYAFLKGYSEKMKDKK